MIMVIPHTAIGRENVMQSGPEHGATVTVTSVFFDQSAATSCSGSPVPVVESRVIVVVGEGGAAMAGDPIPSTKRTVVTVSARIALMHPILSEGTERVHHFMRSMRDR